MKKIVIALCMMTLAANAQQEKTTQEKKHYLLTTEEMELLQKRLSLFPFKDIIDVMSFLGEKKPVAIHYADSCKGMGQPEREDIKKTEQTSKKLEHLKNKEQ